jgi:hypothetical protein
MPFPARRFPAARSRANEQTGGSTADGSPSTPESAASVTPFTVTSFGVASGSHAVHDRHPCRFKSNIEMAVEFVVASDSSLHGEELFDFSKPPPIANASGRDWLGWAQGSHRQPHAMRVRDDCPVSNDPNARAHDTFSQSPSLSVRSGGNVRA